MLSEDEDLLMARRHIAEGQMRIDRQRQLICEMELAGHPTDLAETLLRLLMETLEQMRRHRDYLESCQPGAGGTGGR